MTEKDKLICSDCGHQYRESEILKAPSPFEPDENIYGCPKCKAIDKASLVCDEPRCWEPSTCGWSGNDGYRRTCGKHARWR